MEHIQDKHRNGDDVTSFICEKCPLDKNGLAKSFNSQNVLNRHLKRSHGPLCFKCQVCSKQFRQASHFEKHERTHTPNTDPRLKCEWCSLTLCSKQNLQKHSFVVHNKKIPGVKYFACELCSLEFVNKPSLERHVVHKHVVDKEFKCGVCSKAFIDQETLDKHFKNTHEIRKISHFCDICPKGFKYRKSVIRHLGVKHLKFFYCDKCLKSFSNKTTFDKHIHPKSQVYFKCKICKNESFDSQCNLDIHTNVHHSSLKIIKCGRTNIVKIKTKNKNVKPEELSDKNQVKCQFCSKTFDHESYLQPHRNLQHPDEEWSCSAKNCLEKFKQYNLLKYHVRKHHVAIVCRICQKSFKNQKNLRFHEKTHAVEKQYKCNKCTKSFVCPRYLKTHVAHNHGGPKPFKCPIKNCRKSFATTKALNSHLVSHQKAKLFKFDTCPKSKGFKTSAYLEQHQRGVQHASQQRKRHRQVNKLSDPLSISSNKAHRVFICNSNECCFETLNEKEIALHYNEQHQLPKVLIWSLNYCFKIEK